MRYTYLGVMTCLLWLASCYDDKGNYAYQEINKIEISGLEEAGWYYKIAFVDTLRNISGCPVRLVSGKYG